MPKIGKICFLLLIFALFLTFNVPVLLAQGDGGSCERPNITIDSLDSSQFPQVQMMLSAGGCQLDPTQMTLTENGEPQPIKVKVDRDPQTVVLVIDGGRYSLARLRQNYPLTLMREIWAGLLPHLAENNDRVILQIARHDSTTNGEQRLITVADTTSFAEVESAILEIEALIEDGIDLDSALEIQSLPMMDDIVYGLEREMRPTIFWVTTTMHSPNNPPDGYTRSEWSSSEVAKTAARVGASVFVLHAPAHLTNLAEPLELLADKSEGAYLQLVTNRSNTKAVSELVESQFSGSTQVELIYTSNNFVDSARELTLSYGSGETSQAVSHQYEAAIPRPKILLNGDVIEQDEQIRFAVSWPSGADGTIKEVQLNGETIPFDQVEGDISIIMPTGTSEVALIVIDQDGYMSEPKMIALMPSSQATIEMIPTPIIEQSSNGEGLPFTWIWVAVGTVILGGLLVGGMLYLRQGKSLSERTTLRERFDTIASKDNRRSELIGMLEVISPEGLVAGNQIPLYEDQLTTLGRDPQLSDVQLYDLNIRSTVSGQHCTFNFERNSVWVTDNNSSSGTFVNNLPIESNELHPLSHADEILLGDLARKGVLLKLTLLQPGKWGVTVDDPTYPDAERAGTKTEIPMWQPADESAEINRTGPINWLDELDRSQE